MRKILVVGYDIDKIKKITNYYKNDLVFSTVGLCSEENAMAILETVKMFDTVFFVGDCTQNKTAWEVAAIMHGAVVLLEDENEHK